VHASAALLLELGLVLTVLTLLGTAARRFNLSPIPLYLLAGLALGDGGIAPNAQLTGFLEAGATIGVVLLLLTLGLEFSVGEFAESMRRHLPSAGVDLVLNMTPGAVAGALLGLDAIGILAMAGITYVSSSGVASRLLTDLRRLGNRETPAVLSVLVLEDFAMAAYLPLLSVLAAGGSVMQAVIGMVIALTALTAAFAVSYRWGPHIGRLVSHPDAEQLLLRLLGLTLVVAALAEYINASAAVGAFLVGLTLTGETAQRARVVLSPLRDLFTAVFFVAIGLTTNAAHLIPMLPAALLLAAITAGTKMLSGAYAARIDGVGRQGRLRAGSVLVVRGEFSLVVIALVGEAYERVADIGTPYVFILAIAGPVLTRYLGAPREAPGRASSPGI